MLKQKVFFFAARGEGSDSMIKDEELQAMAVNYVNLYGAGCLSDLETPSFVRRMMGKRAEGELPRAG